MIDRADTPEPTSDGRARPGSRGTGPSGVQGGGLDVFFAALQMSRMPMCLSDPQQPDNPIVFCNQAFEQLTGYAQHEAVGRNCRFLQGPGTDPAAVAEIRRSLAAGQDVRQELLNYRRDGSAFWNALFISPVLDSAGAIVYHFASQLDVTRARAADAVLQQAQRMEILGAMATGLAHEFNELMTVTLGSIERAAAEPEPGRRAAQLDRAGSTAMRAARLTDQILAFSRRQSRQAGIVDVNRTLAECEPILGRMAADGVTVTLELHPDPLPVRIDPGQLELAVLGLVRSAAGAALPEGGIRVVARSRRRDDAPGAPADTVEVAVHGTARFTVDEAARQAAAPLLATGRHGGEIGLGLSMARRFTEESCGVMEVADAAGPATVVRLLFPLADGEAPA